MSLLNGDEVMDGTIWTVWRMTRKQQQTSLQRKLPQSIPFIYTFHHSIHSSIEKVALFLSLGRNLWRFEYLPTWEEYISGHYEWPDMKFLHRIFIFYWHWAIGYTGGEVAADMYWWWVFHCLPLLKISNFINKFSYI